MADVYIKNLDKEKKDKAMYVLNCRGKDLTKAVRELVDEWQVLTIIDTM